MKETGQIGFPFFRVPRWLFQETPKGGHPGVQNMEQMRQGGPHSADGGSRSEALHPNTLIFAIPVTELTNEGKLDKQHDPPLLSEPTCCLPYDQWPAPCLLGCHFLANEACGTHGAKKIQRTCSVEHFAGCPRVRVHGEHPLLFHTEH